MPDGSGQGDPKNNHDNDGIGPVDVPIDCSTMGPPFPGGVDPVMCFPVTTVLTPSLPTSDWGPAIACSFADSAPVCSGSTRTSAFTPPPPKSYQGFGWFQESRPELVVDDSGSIDPADDAATPDRLRIILGARKVLDFSLVAGSSPNVFVGVNGEAGAIERVSGSTSQPELYVYRDTRGKVMTFFGFYTGSGGTWINPYGATGQYWKTENADGSSSSSAHYTGHPTSATSAMSSGWIADGSSHPTHRPNIVYDGVGRRWTYSYTTTSSGWTMLSQVKIDTGSGTAPIQTHDYTYYASGSSYGLEGDLKLITVTEPLSPSATNRVSTWYFRYYTSDGASGGTSGTYGFKHLIKFRVDPEGVRLAGGVAGLDAITVDSTVKTYSSYFYEYDSIGRVARLETGSGCSCGGSTDGVYTFARADNGSYTAADYDGTSSTASGSWGAGGWKRRTTAIHPNGTQQALYFDKMGHLLGMVYSDAASATYPFDPGSGNALWIHKFERDGYMPRIGELMSSRLPRTTVHRGSTCGTLRTASRPCTRLPT